MFLYVCLGIAILVPLKPWQSMLLYTSNWLFFAVILNIYIMNGLDPFSSLLNSAFTSILCISVSILLQRTQVNDFLKEKTILDQNTKIRQMNDQLQTMVTVDELTQINNRRFMEREFPILVNDARNKQLSVAFIMMDIDHFKNYNDRYGHQAGDNCLHKVAYIIKSLLPERNSYFVRYGGEEFLLMLVGMSPENVRELAERIRTGVEAADIKHEDSPSGNVTLSIGVCCSRENGKATVSQMVRYADMAMYDAKANGRNSVSVYMYTNK